MKASKASKDEKRVLQEQSKQFEKIARKLGNENRDGAPQVRQGLARKNGLIDLTENENVDAALEYAVNNNSAIKASQEIGSEPSKRRRVWRSPSKSQPKKTCKTSQSSEVLGSAWTLKSHREAENVSKDDGKAINVPPKKSGNREKALTKKLNDL